MSLYHPVGQQMILVSHLSELASKPIEGAVDAVGAMRVSRWQ